MNELVAAVATTATTWRVCKAAEARWVYPQRRSLESDRLRLSLDLDLDLGERDRRGDLDLRTRSERMHTTAGPRVAFLTDRPPLGNQSGYRISTSDHNTIADTIARHLSVGGWWLLRWLVGWLVG